MRVILILTIGILSTSCATNPEKEYSELLETKSQVAAKSPADAVKMSKNELLVKGEKIGFELDDTDPTLSIDGVVSFYQVFTVEVELGEKVSITSYSPIKSSPILYIVRPRIFVINPEGMVILDSMKNEKVGRAWGGMGPIQFQADWEFEATSRGQFLILATSDNRNLGEKVAYADNDPTVGALFRGLKAHSTGPMYLLWNN